MPRKTRSSDAVVALVAGILPSREVAFSKAVVGTTTREAVQPSATTRRRWSEGPRHQPRPTSSLASRSLHTPPAPARLDQHLPRPSSSTAARTTKDLRRAPQLRPRRVGLTTTARTANRRRYEAVLATRYPGSLSRPDRSWLHRKHAKFSLLSGSPWTTVALLPTSFFEPRRQPLAWSLSRTESSFCDGRDTRGFHCRRSPPTLSTSSNSRGTSRGNA